MIHMKSEQKLDILVSAMFLQIVVAATFSKPQWIETVKLGIKNLWQMIYWMTAKTNNNIYNIKNQETYIL